MDVRTARVTHVFHHSAGAVVIQDGKCLVLRQRREWVFPKGHLEFNEPPQVAALREVREETGLEVEIDAPLGTTRYEFGTRAKHPNRKRVDWFLAHPVGGSLSVEAIFREAAFVDEAEAERLLTHEADRELARRAFERAAELAK